MPNQDLNPEINLSYVHPDQVIEFDRDFSLKESEILLRIKQSLPERVLTDIPASTLDPWIIEIANRGDHEGKIYHVPAKSDTWQVVNNRTEMESILNEVEVELQPKSREIEVPILSEDRISQLFGPKQRLLVKMGVDEIIRFFNGEVIYDQIAHNDHEHVLREAWREIMNYYYGDIFELVYRWNNQLSGSMRNKPLQAIKLFIASAAKSNNQDLTKKLDELLIQITNVRNPQNQTRAHNKTLNEMVKQVQDLEDLGLAELKLLADESTTTARMRVT